jgi:hypothetical protein
MPRRSIVGRVFAALVAGGVGARVVLPAPAAAPAYADSTPRQKDAPQAGGGPATRQPSPAPVPAEFRRGQELLEGFLDRKIAPQSKPGAAARCDAAHEECATLDVLIATLPDPYDSHMDWAYDGQFESVRRAFERAGYVIDRFWMPGRGDSASVAEGRVPARDVQPGVVLFRAAGGQSPTLRLLYVVGEMPTRGVHTGALRTALAERRRLLRYFGADSTAPVRVVGPTFSGSAPSLARVLSDTAWAGKRFEVVSGAATSDATRGILDQPPRVRFSATLNPVSALEAVFQREVRRGLNIKAEQVAVLRETSTLYGRSVGRSDDSTLVVPVPLNISGMRAQYEAHPGGGGGDVPPQEQLPLGRREARIPLPLQDDPRPREDPVVASQLTAPTVEIAIDEIVRTLREHRVRLVGLQFTDVRDKLFLAREIRQRMHEVQFYTFGSNALLLRPELAGYLRGTLVVSSYPLLLENQWWAPKPASGRSERIAFASEGAEGVYNAALVQLGADSSLVEYGMSGPSGDSIGRPPVWITAVGTGSFVPVTYSRPGDAATRAYVHAARRTVAPRSEPERRTDGLAALGGCVSLGVGVGGLAFGAVANAVKRRRLPAAGARRKHGWALWQSVQVGSLLLHREIYLLLLLISLGGLVAPLFELIRLGHGGEFPVPLLPGLVRWLWRFAVLTGAGLWAAILLRYFRDGRDYALRGAWTRPADGLLWNLEVVGRTLVIFAGVAFAALTGWLSRDLARLANAKDLHFELLYHRALDVASGVSPLAPLLVGAAGFAVWSVWHLNRIRLLSRTTAYEYALLRRAGSARLRRRRRGEPEELSGRLEKNVSRVRDSLFLLLPNRGGLVVGAVLAFVAAWLFMSFGLTLDTMVFTPTPRLPVYGARGLAVVAILATLVLGALGGLNLAVVARRQAHLRRSATRDGAGDARKASGGEGSGSAAEASLLAQTGVALAGAGLALAFLAALEANLGLSARVETALAPFGEATSFDLLFRFGAIGTAVATVWGLYRFLAVWQALRHFLGALEETPLLNAFNRLPPRISRLARMSIFGTPSRDVVDAVAGAQWLRLQRLYSGAEGADGAEVAPSAQAGAAATPVKDHVARALAAQPAVLAGFDARIARQHAWVCREEFWKVEDSGEAFDRVLRVVECVWESVPAADQIARIRAWEPDAGGDEGTAARAEKPYAHLDPCVAEWLATAEEFVAVQAVDYVQTVLEQLRNLALFLFVSLLITTTLLASYPFFPQGLVKGVFLVVLLATVGSLLVVMVQMNRDEILSRIAGTQPGRITWDGSFIFNAAAVGILPLLALVSSEYPAVRTALFSWVEPLVRTVFKS